MYAFVCVVLIMINTWQFILSSCLPTNVPKKSKGKRRREFYIFTHLPFDIFRGNILCGSENRSKPKSMLLTVHSSFSNFSSSSSRRSLQEFTFLFHLLTSSSTSSSIQCFVELLFFFYSFSFFLRTMFGFNVCSSIIALIALFALSSCFSHPPFLPFFLFFSLSLSLSLSLLFIIIFIACQNDSPVIQNDVAVRERANKQTIERLCFPFNWNRRQTWSWTRVPFPPLFIYIY